MQSGLRRSLTIPIVRYTCRSKSLPAFNLLTETPESQSKGSKRQLEQWRLWLPGRPSSYTHDCAVVATEALVNSFVGFEDAYDSAYNLARHSLEETEQIMFGESPFSGLFGAPV